MTDSEVSHLEQIAPCFKFSRTLQWPKKWFVKSCLAAGLSASPYLCGSTYWNGVRRSAVGSSIMSIGTIYTTLFWCSLKTQVGHSSLWVHLIPVYGIRLRYQEMIVSDGVCFVRLWDRLSYINKECWIPWGEIYVCHFSRAGHVIIQARVTAGEDEAFQTSAVLPLRKWIRLDCYIQNSQV